MIVNDVTVLLTMLGRPFVRCAFCEAVPMCAERFFLLESAFMASPVPAFTLWDVERPPIGVSGVP